MYNEGQKPGNGFLPSSFRALSGYLRIVSSGASTVASTVRSAANSIAVDSKAESDARLDQVLWAGFDKLEFERNLTRRVLLLGYRSGFQVWDVEDAHNVHDLVSRYDSPVSFLQMLSKPSCAAIHEDKFSDSRPLLVVYTDGSFLKDGKSAYRNGSISKIHDSDNGIYGPSTLRFYSLTSHSYVHVLKFRSAVYSVRCSSRVVAVSQSAQVHCFNAATLEREYTILTNPIVTSNPGSEGIGFGPLALGSRWLAYSGSLVDVSNAGSVNRQQLNTSASFSNSVSNGNRVALYAKESSKHLATGIATKLSRSGVLAGKANGAVNGHLPRMDNVGMVIVKDVVTKIVITQFRAHKSPISALCFDPSGTLLVTASVQGHNINVFRILPVPPGTSRESDSSRSYIHLYRLQRGLTNAIIQDITFSNDSQWIMISSSRGTNHLFAISPFGGTVDLQAVYTSFDINGSSFSSNPVVRWPPKRTSQIGNEIDRLSSGPPVTLSVVSRIRNGNNGWRGTVNSATAVATGKNSSLSGAIATTFCYCEGNDMHVNPSSSRPRYNLLVFSPSGCLIQYALRVSVGLDTTASVVNRAYESAPGNDSKLVLEATQKWNISQKRREQDDNCDIYGENGSQESNQNVYGPYLSGKRTTTSRTEERKHFYISEAELQMHERQVPLWSKSQICFQLMMLKGTTLDIEHATGEIEIEGISTHGIEARRKNLVPLFDHLDSPRSAPPRIVTPDAKFAPQPLHQRSNFSQNGHLPSGGNALALVTENGAELHHRMGDSTDGVLKLSNTTKGSVYTNNGLKRNPKLQIVNSRERSPSKLEANLKFVNTHSEDFKMNHSLKEDEAEVFD